MQLQIDVPEEQYNALALWAYEQGWKWEPLNKGTRYRPPEVQRNAARWAILELIKQHLQTASFLDG